MPFPAISSDTPFVIGALAKSKRGQTYATINSDQNSVFQLTGFDSPLLVPFAAGVFQEKGDETRINLDAVVDGPLLPKHMPCAATAVIRGDNRSLSIAGASIIAKHSRDLIMQALDQDWPAYGWRQNNGYGTRQHQLALEKYGISPHHRCSFAPIKRLVKTANPAPGHY